jgi:hypothetical protein
MGKTNLDGIGDELDVTAIKVNGVVLTTANAVSGDETQIASASGAITIPAGMRKTVFITNLGIAALTLANPVATTDDGKELLIVSESAYAHTVTENTTAFAPGGHKIGTFSAVVGDKIRLMAFNAVWYIIENVGVVLSG